MNTIAIFLEVHQPRRLRRYSMKEIGHSHSYFWDEKNYEIMQRVTKKCYVPALKVFMESGVKASVSLSGTFMEQAKEYAPESIDEFKSYFKSGLSEAVAETYYHSLASIWNESEFAEQVKQQVSALKREFGVKPESFRNTELIYSDKIADAVKSMGFKRVLAEGTDYIISRHSPNYIYRAKSGISLFLRNYRLSDDISFRFSNWEWPEYPLTADKYARWISETPGNIANLFMDFETFGEHQVAETGIFEFVRALPKELKGRGIEMVTLEEADRMFEKSQTISVPEITSWADTRRDLSPWLGNEMQKQAFSELKRIDKKDHVWRSLQTSDHLYYMSTGTSQDITVHEYFNPYKSPYYAFLSFMNVMQDIKMQ
ncbi:MAG: glycoside hydrolase family 57 protein [Conexivisphaerales archaeon]